jgi:hypothetical protein
MINAIINHKDKTAVIEFPLDLYPLYQSLTDVGFQGGPHRVKLTHNEGDDMRVKLYSESDFGNHLILLFNENDTLEDVHTVVGAITNAPDEVKEQLEEYILNDQLDTKEELYDLLTELKEANAPVVTTFYCPLSGQIYDGYDGGTSDVDGRFLSDYISEIEEKLEHEQNPDFEIADYITDHPTANAKLKMARWSVEEIGGVLYGRIDCRSAEAFTPEEIEAIKDGISGQNSDGFGEGFEQREIHTDDGDLYVSFWQSGNDYFIHTQSEMDEYINQGQGLKMGGM